VPAQNTPSTMCRNRMSRRRIIEAPWVGINDIMMGKNDSVTKAIR